MYSLFDSVPVIWSVIIKFHMNFCENNQPVINMKILPSAFVQKIGMFWGMVSVASMER